MRMAPPPIPPPRQSAFTTTTAVPLYWCRYGDQGSEPLLVLHGGPGAHHDYLLPQMLALEATDGRRELFFFDQRGGGRSRTEDREPITWRTQVADLGVVIHELGLDSAALTLVGYSWGGLLAILYAAECARNTALPPPDTLVLIDPAPISRHYRHQFEREFARRQSSREVGRMRAELAESDLRESDPAAFRQRSFELSVAGYFADPRSASNLTPFRVSARVQQSVWDSLGDFDLAADGTLTAIHQPTLIVYGRQDPIPLASAEEAAKIMNAELVRIDDCGHVPYVEQPAVLFSSIAAYLAGRRNVAKAHGA